MPKNTLPSVDDGPATKPQQQQRQQTETREWSRSRNGYLDDLGAFRRVDVKLPNEHRRILRDKIRSLQDSGATLRDGSKISDKTKAILWILENEVQL